MDEDRSYTISRTLNGDTIYYIARNKGGIVFARELTLEKLQKAIKAYKEPPPAEEGEVPVGAASAKGSGEPRKKRASKETPPAEEPIPPEPKQVKNELQAQVAEKRKGSKKKSFWDKLK